MTRPEQRQRALARADAAAEGRSRGESTHQIGNKLGISHMEVSRLIRRFYPEMALPRHRGKCRGSAEIAALHDRFGVL
jgi:hypothetical protein